MVTAISVKLPNQLHVSEQQFWQFVTANPELRLERTYDGQLLVMSPTGSEGGNYNAELNIDLGLWNRQTQQGKVFDSSTGFRLPNGAIRSPDFAWVRNGRWNALTPEQRQGFAPLCPDFVIELASVTDTWADLQAKMAEYIDNGCQLGWLIDPKAQIVEIYRPGQAVRQQSTSILLSGEELLPGLRLDLRRIFADSSR